MAKFDNDRYITTNAYSRLPVEMIGFLWGLVDSYIRDHGDADYLQVFRLSPTDDDKQRVIHSQEVPDYEQEYIVDSSMIELEFIADEKVYIIDDGDHSTLLLAEDY